MGVPEPDAVVAEIERAGQRLVDTGSAYAPAQVLRRAASDVYRRLGATLRTSGLLGDQDLVALGAAHQRLLDHTPTRAGNRFRLVAGSTARKATGSYYTPLPLVEHLLDQTVEAALEEVQDPFALRVLDPACGSGLFLVLAARRIARRAARDDPRLSLPTAVRRAVSECVVGVDLDPLAVELARLCLVLSGNSGSGREPSPRLRVADALTDDSLDGGGFDVVVGNPPFRNQLTRTSARSAETSRRLQVQAAGALGPYTDLSAVFLHRAVRWLREGGRVGLVQPQSLLGARDAAGVRRHLAQTCALESLWSSDASVFEAHVVACAPVLRKAGRQDAVRRTHGPQFRQLSAVSGADLSGEWSPLISEALGVPQVALRPSPGRVGDLANCTADFRETYYGLAPYVRELADCPAGAPLVTAGLIEPAGCLWGSRPTRYLKQRWLAPVVDVGRLGADARLAAWAERRRVPKVLVATQGAVLEAVVDREGDWLPSVPTITVVSDPDRLWHVLAVLLAPPVSAYAASRYAGTGLSARAVKVSARQVAALPLPVDRACWDRGAELAAAVQRGDPGSLRDLGQVMCDAYQTSADVLQWWLRRVASGRPSVAKVKTAPC